MATKDIEDALTTEQNRQAARDAVQTVYILDADKGEKCIDNISQAFDSVISVHDQGAVSYTHLDVYKRQGKA